MKKSILATAVMLVTVLSSAFANKSEINQRALQSFKKDFMTARNVSWEQQREYSKATFSLYNHVMFAYYNQDGELMAVIRNILSEQLPIRLMTEVKNKYKGYWISELFEVATEGQTTYYVTLENSDEKLVLQSNGFDQWSSYKKEKKDYVVL